MAVLCGLMVALSAGQEANPTIDSDGFKQRHRQRPQWRSRGEFGHLHAWEY